MKKNLAKNPEKITGFVIKKIAAERWTKTHAAKFFGIRPDNFYSKLSGRVAWTAEDEKNILSKNK